jgi:ABC-type nitrate/sulfonate/bicarbonate transport system substrate-binding protein/outer membrane protein OmpA-like peptidoglycan-associated protein
MESGSKGLVIGILALVLIGGGAVAWKFLVSHDDAPSPNNPPATAPLPALPGGKQVDPSSAQQLPFIFWGGDVATFVANGGLKTTPDSSFGKQGLNINLVPGDAFDKQVEAYLAGKSNFLRGTLSMLGQVSDQLTAKDETTPVVFLQLTWSAGDHLVGRKEFKNLNDIKGKKIALQSGGPHVGMLNDILHTARLDWKDITVVWTDEVSGDKGPAAAMRKDSSIDGCFAISPEMFELTSAPETGGTTSKGDGTKSSIKGAHVVVSTQDMSRAIADVYACRKDFFRGNRDWIEKFVAGYLRGSEEIIDLKGKVDKKDAKAKQMYDKHLKMAQSIWSKDPAFAKSVEKLDDVDGLVGDAVFVGLPGNEAFFQREGKLSLQSFKFKQEQACRLPGDPSKERPKDNPKLFLSGVGGPEGIRPTYVRKIGDLHGTPPKRPRIDPSAESKFGEEIFRFRISFEPNKDEFNEADYQNEFQRALEVSSLFGNTMVVLRGHADPAVPIKGFIEHGKAQDLITGSGYEYVWKADGTKFDVRKDIKKMLQWIDSKPPNTFKLGPNRGETSKEIVQSLQELSQRRAGNAKAGITRFAESKRYVMDDSQFRLEGVGVSQPEYSFPEQKEEYDANRRVEFIILKVPEDKINKGEFDL